MLVLIIGKAVLYGLTAQFTMDSGKYPDSISFLERHPVRPSGPRVTFGWTTSYTVCKSVVGGERLNPGVSLIAVLDTDICMLGDARVTVLSPGTIQCWTPLTRLFTCSEKYQASMYD